MTNEQYLIVSYFAVIAGGVVLAALTAVLLVDSLRRAVVGLLSPVASVLRRALPTWLVLAALLGFLAVSYVDCDHSNYEEAVADRDHLVAVTHSQAKHVLNYLALGVLVYAGSLGIALIVCPSRREAQ